MAYDVYQWVFLMLRGMALITFVFYSNKTFALYGKFKDHYHTSIVRAVCMSLFFEIVLKTIALVGVEAMHGESYGNYIAQKGMHMNDFLMCSFNLSLQIPAYIILLATILVLQKWI